nr:hypothetical protein [uncultured Hyphomonas sp.]
MAWTSYWLMVVSCVGLLGVVGTLYEARRLFKETRDSNFIQREIGWNQTRAYVTVSNCTFSMEPGNIPTVRARFKNNGSSPAKDMVIQRRLGVRMVPLSPDDFDLPYIEGESRISLGSGSEIEIIQDAPPMAPEMLAAYEGELAVLVFFGEVTYRDIFDRAFVTKFRMTRKRSQRLTAMTFTAEGNSST